jgi:NitT/TauT family transport system substrate-binding protein
MPPLQGPNCRYRPDQDIVNKGSTLDNDAAGDQTRSLIMSSEVAARTRRDVLRAGVGFAGGLLAPPLATPQLARAQGADPVRFSLEFRIYGGNAPLFLGAESGIFRQQGIEVTMDGSGGSVESVTRVATGTHAFGLADLSTLVEFTARNPKEAPKLIMTVFDRFPAVVLSLKRKPIKTLPELVGAKVGTGSVDAGSKIFPALLALNKVDLKAINRMTVDVKLRDTMLIKGEVDAVVGFDYTTIFNLIEAGLKLEDITLLYFADFGFDFWGNSLIVNPTVLEKNPDLVKRVAIAVARSWAAAAKDRAAAISAVTKRDGLLKATTERARMDWVLDRLVMTQNVRQNGIGNMDAQRMERGINLLKEGFQLATAPTMEQIYDDRFLPPAADRKLA